MVAGVFIAAASCSAATLMTQQSHAPCAQFCRKKKRQEEKPKGHAAVHQISRRTCHGVQTSNQGQHASAVNSC